MHGDDFKQSYERLTDNELAQVLADKESLVPEAAEALDREVQRRHFVPPAPPTWTQPPDSVEPVNCLEDYSKYQELVAKKKSFGRYGYLLAMGPFVLALAPAVKLNNGISSVLIGATLSWTICVVFYGLILNTRFLGFRCPQCSQSFGRGSECFNCGFPRSR
jgi:hypothetical protein